MALQVERKHGSDAARYVAERIGVAAISGEKGGLELWKAVAIKLESLTANGKPIF